MEGRHQMLVVEDDPATGYALKRLLRHRGCDVTLAGTVGEAIEALSTPPDVVLLDLMLPDGDGEEVLHWVRSECPPRRVVVYSAATDRRRLDRVAALGPDAMLRKPQDIEAIWQACFPLVAAGVP